MFVFQVVLKPLFSSPISSLEKEVSVLLITLGKNFGLVFSGSFWAFTRQDNFLSRFFVFIFELCADGIVDAVTDKFPAISPF